MEGADSLTRRDNCRLNEACYRPVCGGRGTLWTMGCIHRLRVTSIGRATRTIVAIVAIGCAASIVAVPANAAARDVVADYFKDGQVDHAYSIDDLRGALVFARRHASTAPQYSAFADAVNQAITESLVGSGDAAQQQLTTPRARTEISPPPTPLPAPAPSNLPAPPQGAPADSTPLVVPVMAIGAAILILAGIGSSVWRRMRR